MLAVGDEGGDIAADPQRAVEKRPLSRHLAGPDALGCRRVGDHPDVGFVGRPAHDLDLSAADPDGPALTVDDLLLDGELEIVGGVDGGGRRRQLREPLVGQKGGHVVRLGARGLASADVGPERRPPAKLAHRVGARVLDVVTLTWLLFFVLVEIDQRLLGGDPWGQQPLQIDLTEARPLLLTILVIAVYEIVPVATKGATLGKALFGLRLVASDRRGALPWARALARALVLYGAPVALGAYGGIVLLVLLASFAIPASGRGIHDRVAGSIVVALPREDPDP